MAVALAFLGIREVPVQSEHRLTPTGGRDVMVYIAMLFAAFLLGGSDEHTSGRRQSAASTEPRGQS